MYFSNDIQMLEKVIEDIKNEFGWLEAQDKVSCSFCSLLNEKLEWIKHQLLICFRKDVR